jgi:hypothetical protein
MTEAQGNGAWQRRSHRGPKFAVRKKPSKDQRRRGRGSDYATKYRMHSTVDGQVLFNGRYATLLGSPAIRVLTATEHKLLNCLEFFLLENKRHQKNWLTVTYDDFVEYGISRRQIAGGIRALEDLKLIKCRHGVGNSENHFPNQFQLPYLQTADTSWSFEWREITTLKDAKTIARKARKDAGRYRRHRHRTRAESGPGGRAESGPPSNHGS